MFGGFTYPVVLLGDTWTYDPEANSWTELAPSGTLPAPRYAGRGMVYDPAIDRVILFGGYGEDGPLKDTWAYDAQANAWTNLEPGGSVPAARYGHSMVYDSATETVILYGGRDEDGRPIGGMWSYNPSTNSWAELEPTLRPDGVDISMWAGGQPIVSIGGRVILPGAWSYEASSHLWNYLDPEGPTPPEAADPGMAYDSADAMVIAFGGMAPGSSVRVFGDTWAYDPGQDRWLPLEPSGPLPSARCSTGMVYDAKRGQVIMFGGYAGSGAALNDTWAYSPPGDFAAILADAPDHEITYAEVEALVTANMDELYLSVGVLVDDASTFGDWAAAKVVLYRGAAPYWIFRWDNGGWVFVESGGSQEELAASEAPAEVIQWLLR
jgi:hypothetical protein